MRRLLFVLSCAAMTTAAPAGAQERTKLDDLVAEALASHPSIAAARSGHDAALQRIPQEKSLPDPMVSAGWNASGAPWPGAGLGTEPTANIGAMVSQEFPYPGKRGLRVQVAAKEADAAAEDVDAARLAITSRVKQAYYRLAYTYAADEILARNRDLLDTLLKGTEQRYATGSAAQSDVIRSQSELTSLELQRERLLQDRRGVEIELNALRGKPSDTPIAPPEPLTLPDLPVGSNALPTGEQSPRLRRDALMVQRADAAIASAKSEFKPDFGVSGGYYTMGSMPAMWEFRFDVNLPSRKAKRNAAVAEQTLLRVQASQMLDADRLELTSQIAQERQVADTAARLARLYRDTALPQAHAAWESSLATYQTGRLDFSALLMSFQSVLEDELAYDEQVAALHASLARIEELTGTPFVH
jgi:outer membrane protein TolC